MIAPRCLHQVTMEEGENMPVIWDGLRAWRLQQFPGTQNCRFHLENEAVVEQ